MQRQEAREAEYTAQLLGRGDAWKKGHGSTLRESSQDDTGSRNTGLHLSLDQLVDIIIRPQDPDFILISPSLSKGGLESSQLIEQRNS